jgi:hypothetical protein
LLREGGRVKVNHLITLKDAGSQKGQENKQEEESKEARRHNATIHKVFLRSRQGGKVRNDGRRLHNDNEMISVLYRPCQRR